MDVFELSTINFGLVLESRKSAREYSPDDFVTPYDEGIRVLQQDGATKEDVAKLKTFNVNVLNDAHNAVHKMNGLGEFENFDWRVALQKAKRAYDLSRSAKKVMDRLERNEDADLSFLHLQITSMLNNEAYGLTQASTLDYGDYKPFQPCGYEPLDKIIGGIPTDGPIVIYGKTGVGKSHFSALMVDKLLHLYPNKTAAIYTLEMGHKHWLWRETNMYPSLKDVLERVYISSTVRKIDELISEVTAKSPDYVIVDDIDHLVKSKDAGAYELSYMVLNDLCRFNNIPVFILGQPNRAAKLDDGFLGPYDISWSGGGENSAALLIALQKTNMLNTDDTTFPTFDDDKYYIIIHKSREKSPLQQGTGAIILDACNKLWSGLPVSGQDKKPLWKLWSSGSGSGTSKIGKRKGE